MCVSKWEIRSRLPRKQSAAANYHTLPQPMWFIKLNSGERVNPVTRWKEKALSGSCVKFSAFQNFFVRRKKSFFFVLYFGLRVLRVSLVFFSTIYFWELLWYCCWQLCTMISITPAERTSALLSGGFVTEDTNGTFDNATFPYLTEVNSVDPDYVNFVNTVNNAVSRQLQSE